MSALLDKEFYMRNFKKRILYVSGMMVALCWSVAIFAQQTATKTVENGSNVEVRNKVGAETFLDMILAGGFVMIPLFICSLVALTFFLERIIVLRKNKIIPSSFIPGLKNTIGEGHANLDRAFEYCVNSRTPIGNIIKVGVEKWRKGRSSQDVEKAVEEAASRKVSSMVRTLRVFKIIAGISPLLGLLGTVLGLIRTFKAVAAATESLGQDKAAKLAAGIYEAMVTTATGLIIAAPVLLMYYLFLWLVDKLADDIEVACTDFMDVYQEANK